MFRAITVQIIAFDMQRIYHPNMTTTISLYCGIHKALKTIHPAKVLSKDHIILVQPVKNIFSVHLVQLQACYSV